MIPLCVLSIALLKVSCLKETIYSWIYSKERDHSKNPTPISTQLLSPNTPAQEQYDTKC